MMRQMGNEETMSSFWKENIAQLYEILGRLCICDHVGKELSHDEAFSEWKKLTVQLRSDNRTLYLIGNGASASMASHISADLGKNALVRTEVFTDLSLLTACANDLGYEKVFAFPLKLRMNKADMLVAISSSGNSLNIIRAAEIANECGGNVVTLSAMEEGNALRRLGVLNFYVPAQTYGMAETSHAAILHYWVDQMVEHYSESLIDMD